MAKMLKILCRAQNVVYNVVSISGCELVGYAQKGCENGKLFHKKMWKRKTFSKLCEKEKTFLTIAVSRIKTSFVPHMQTPQVSERVFFLFSSFLRKTAPGVFTRKAKRGKGGNKNPPMCLFSHSPFLPLPFLLSLSPSNIDCRLQTAPTL